MNKMSLILCVAVLATLVAARPKPGISDQIKDMGLDTGSVPNFGLDTGSIPDFGLDTGSIPDFGLDTASVPNFGGIMCKGSSLGGGKGKGGFPGFDKFPGFGGGSDCTSEASKTTDSGDNTEATAVVIEVTTAGS